MWTRLRACRARRGPDVAARRLQLAQALPSRARRPGHPGGARTDRLRASPRTVQTCAGDGFRESETERTSVSSWPAPASHGGRHARIDAPEEARAQGAPAVTLLARRDDDLYRCAERPTPLTSTTDLPAPARSAGTTRRVRRIRADDGWDIQPRANAADTREPAAAFTRQQACLHGQSEGSWTSMAAANESKSPLVEHGRPRLPRGESDGGIVDPPSRLPGTATLPTRSTTSQERLRRKL